MSDAMLSIVRHLLAIARLHAGKADEADQMVERAIRRALANIDTLPHQTQRLDWLEGLLKGSMQSFYGP